MSSPASSVQSVAADPAAVKATRELVDRLVRTLKTLRLYTPDNAVYQNALAGFAERLVAFLADQGSLSLGVTRGAFELDGEAVYQDDSETDGLAFRLHADGVRALHFKAGLPQAEALQAVALLAQGTALVAASDNAVEHDDDLVTLFWDAALGHVELTCVSDDPPLGALQPSHPDQPLPELGTVATVARARPVSPSAPPVQFGPELLSVFRLSDADQTHLDQLLAREQAVDPIADVVGILGDVLSLESDDDEFVDLLTMYSDFLNDFLVQGRFELACRQMQHLNQLCDTGTGLNETRKTALADARNRQGSVEQLAALGEGMARVSEDDAQVAHLLAYVAALPAGDAAALVDVAGAAPKVWRGKLLDQVATWSQSDHSSLLALLNDADPARLKCALTVLSAVADLPDLPAFAVLAEHDDVAVRRAALEAICHISPNGHGLLLPYLADAEVTVRRRALTAVTDGQFRAALDALQGLIGGPLFAHMRMGEQRALFAAVGTLGGDDVLDFFAPMLKPRRKFFGKRKGEAESLCAVSGAKAVGTDAAKALLDTGTKHHNERVRAACKYALRELEGSL